MAPWEDGLLEEKEVENPQGDFVNLLIMRRGKRLGWLDLDHFLAQYE